MGDIAKGVLSGAWTLLVGWILPTALNLSVAFYAVAPSLRHTDLIARLWPTTRTGTALLLLTGAVLIGIVLSALQNPLYRILEGYLLWPNRAYRRACGHQADIKWHLSDRIALLGLERLEQREGALPPEEATRLEELRDDRRLARVARKDRQRTAPQRALLEERLARYPVDDGQILPTRLGNAIRRFEEYGDSRFCLDTQVLWNELTGTAPEEIRRQVELARTSVDFFVALLVGHAAIAATAAASLASARAETTVLLVTIAVLSCLIPLWYRSAVTATDEWAAAVRALVNVGRKPLAEALGLVLPPDLAGERTMWNLITQLAQHPDPERDISLNPYRARPTGTN
ncbi:hypothetical protein OG787_50910 [Streptomyces sp. NBC_00075]|uniref:hypothetical protein n=1 Tax=Streptomyces sp. NBC_00075 TaxID=2975641 RepID=UPI003255C9C9